MKHLLGYVIWNKASMIKWLLEGISDSFDPVKVDLAFVFDDPTDGSFSVFSENIDLVKDFKVVYTNITRNPYYKFPCQNMLMDFAQQEYRKYISLICPQDDQRITDPDFVYNLEYLLRSEKNVGIIGCRDGFDFGYGNMVSSEWSESEYDQPRIKRGDYRRVSLINDGPIIYPLSTINKVGKHDVETYHRFYIEDDYGMLCNAEGLTNYVMGNSLIHDRQKSSLASDHYSSNFGEQDLIKFREKWDL